MSDMGCLIVWVIAGYTSDNKKTGTKAKYKDKQRDKEGERWRCRVKIT
jgi:hypothetical protein